MKRPHYLNDGSGDAPKLRAFLNLDNLLIFTPELLSGTHYYARLFPGHGGGMTEESDRYTQALLYADIARRLFKEAFASG